MWPQTRWAVGSLPTCQPCPSAFRRLWHTDFQQRSPTVPMPPQETPPTLACLPSLPGPLASLSGVGWSALGSSPGRVRWTFCTGEDSPLALWLSGASPSETGREREGCGGGRSRVHGRGVNRLLGRVEGYRGATVVIIAATTLEGSGPPSGQRWVAAVVLSQGVENRSSFYGAHGSCMLALQPCFRVLRSLGGRLLRLQRDGRC